MRMVCSNKLLFLLRILEERTFDLDLQASQNCAQTNQRMNICAFLGEAVARFIQQTVPSVGHFSGCSRW